MKLLAVLALALTVGCKTAPPPTKASTAYQGRCDEREQRIAEEAQARVSGRTFTEHLASEFPDHRVSWLMRETAYQTYVVKAQARAFGRCQGGTCFRFAAPARTLRKAVNGSMKDGKHDPAALGAALGLPAANFEGPLRLITLDLDRTGVCARLPVEQDPGVWACKSAQDKDCFKFGGYTSGGVAETMVIDAPVELATVELVPLRTRETAPHHRRDSR